MWGKFQTCRHTIRPLPEKANMNEESQGSAINRRELLESAGLAAAGGLLLGAGGPQAGGEDKAPATKITRLKATPVGPKAYFKIETSHNITGWGEVTGLDPKVSILK